MDRLRKIGAAVAALAALALGGAAIAGATGGGDGSERGDGGGKLSGGTAQRAGDAALKATGGGTLGQMERDGEKGATYEVEVKRTDGSQVDVRLDGNFGLVAIDGDREDAGESSGD